VHFGGTGKVFDENKIPRATAELGALAEESSWMALLALNSETKGLLPRTSMSALPFIVK
jgi:hypothetical protein